MTTTRQQMQATPAPVTMPVASRFVQRKCACGNHASGGECAECGKKHLSLQRATQNSELKTHDSLSVPSIVHEVLRSPGQPLDSATRAFFEPRFGHDFSSVRLHTDAKAAESARSVNALAYSVGSDVVFGAGQYRPTAANGQRLLAHELSHVLQQPQGRSGTGAFQIAPPSDSNEREAENLSSHVLRGGQFRGSLSQTGLALARFTVRGHHIIEEAALSGAGFSEQQREAVHRGNRQRDFSQVGRTGNTILLCDPSSFGGYSAPEHFDNFIWDAVNERWREQGHG